MAPKSRDWRALAQRLGLTPFTRTIPWSWGMSFHERKRTLGRDATGEIPRFDDQLYGVYAGVEIVLHTFEEGPEDGRTYHTGVLARIDPPALLGLAMGDVPHACPVLPSHVVGPLRVSGFEPARVVDLLDPRESACAAMLHDLLGVTYDARLQVSDSVVAISTRGTVTGGPRLAGMIDVATNAARLLGARRVIVPPTPIESEIQSEWSAFSEQRGLSFSALSGEMTGRLAHSEARVAIETDGQRPRTKVSARFPTPLPIGFSLTRTTERGFFDGILGDRIGLGHPEVDARYRVTGHPEARVRALLGQPNVLDVLVRLGRVVTELEMTWAGLSYAVANVARGDELFFHTEALRVIGETYFGAAEKSGGPYR